jgi:GWxTD domain-containing protein
MLLMMPPRVVLAILFGSLLCLAAQTPPAAVPASAAVKPETFKKWLREDVVYIITDGERAAALRLLTNEERAEFVEQFWLRRDPTPDTVENEYKEEHYRRIAFANEHFASHLPGWKTDRGRIYITCGPPDEIVAKPPSELWHYRYIEGIGEKVTFGFTERNGEYILTSEPPPGRVLH